MRKTHAKPDYVLFSTVLILIGLGLTILISVSAPLAQQKFGSPSYYFLHQIMIGLIPGFVLGFAAFKISLFQLRKWILVLMGVILFLMILVFIPGIGISVAGASRWINLKVISFQPSEFLKLVFIIYLAVWLSRKITGDSHSRFKKRIKTFPETLIGFLVIISFISLLLILQPDISTLAIMVGCAALMYFSAGTPVWHSGLIIFTGLTALLALIKIAPYRLNRLLVFLHPTLDPMGKGYQIKQALITIGSGGMWGAGLGMIQNSAAVPQSLTDSIFAVFARETGFVGSLILIFLFLIFAWRGIGISRKASDRFSQLLALGITSWIVFQAFMNMGSMVGVLPLTGIPLPFISYGGSALIAELMGVGILLNISKKIEIGLRK